MADSRTFTLIGEFKDGITPELAKINKQLATLKASFSGIGSKKKTGFRGATSDIGKLVSAHKKLSESIKGVEGDLRSTLGVLQQYRREMGKAAAATRAFQKSGGALGSRQFAQNMDAANKSAQAYLRTLQQINAQSRRMPRGGGMGAGMQPPRPPRGGYTPPPGGGAGRGGGGGRDPGRAAGGGMGAHMAEFGFAYTLGNALAQPIQNAVVSGFQIGIGLMTKPFEYFADKLKERIEDEQSDIKAAGGMFSIARRQKDPFVKTMDEAMEFTQQNNKVMAELAAALPGNTQQYIEVSKRISDSISRIVMADPTKAIEYSNKLREEEGKQALTGSAQAQAKGAITTLLGEMTKKTVLAGLGGGGGSPGGVAGAYGLPQLTERMLTQQEVSMGQFQRYASIFRDPLIMDALNRFIPKINASAAGTMERFEVMKKFYDEVLPPEMIRKFERSTAGVLELFNTTIFGPETGLFGLGRKMAGMGKMMDDYGNYIKEFEDGTREVVSSMEEASDANLSLFDLLRDSFANLGIALYPILSNLSAIFDPINKVSKLLVDFRQSTGRFLNAFESYKKGFEDMVKGMDAASKKEFLKIGLDLRASLAAVNNFFANAGIINEAEFQKNAEQLMSKSFDYKGMMGGMLDTFLNSDVAGQLGEMIGKIIGTVLTEVAKITGFISGRIQSSNKLFDGLKKGFDDAGGTEAFKNIFKDVFKSLFKVLLEVMKIIPFEAYMLMGAMVVVPAAIQGLGMLIAEKMLAGMLSLKGSVGTMLTQMFARVKASLLGVKPVSVKDLGGRITDPSKMLPPAKETALATTTKAGPLAKGMGGFAKFFMSFGNYIKGVGPRFMGFFKGFLGKLSIFGAVLTSVISLFQGKDLARSLAEGAGPLLGAALGAALIPFLGPFGPMIGAAIGGWVGSMESVVRPLEEAFRAIGATIGPTFQSLADSVLSLFSTLGSVVMGLIGAFIPLDSAVDETTAVVIGLKIVLTPIVAAFQLVEQVANLLAAGFKGLELAVLYARRGLATLNPFGSEEKRQALDAEIERVTGELEKANGRFAESFERHKAWYETKPATAPIPSSLPKVSGTTPTAGEMDWYRKQMGVKPAATELPKVSGLTPTAKEMEWYRKQTGDSILKPTQGIEEATSASVKPISSTAKNSGATVAETKGVRTNTAATTIAVNSLAAKITPQTGLQASVAAIYNLLASGALRVQTGLQFPGMPGASLPPVPYTGPRPGQSSQSWMLERAADPNAWRAKGGLGDAVASELKHKPPGSSLVIANSSETVIPAAGGYGMKDFMNILSAGFTAVNRQYQSLATGVNTLQTDTQNQFKQTETKNADRHQQTTTKINDYQKQTQTEFAKVNQNMLALTKQVSSMSAMGGMGGMALGGGYGAAGVQIAGQLGNYIKATGGAPGSIWEHPMHGGVKGRHAAGSYHYSGRAIDIGAYANEQAGVIARIQQFNAKYGVKPVEFLHAGNDPNHQDHVHVAYALGPRNPAFFSSQSAAQQWERSMVSGSVKVGSVTGNSAEGFGGGTTVTNNITINQQPGQSADELASIVAMKIGEAVADARAASIFV